jgi:hypothetical protein
LEKNDEPVPIQINMAKLLPFGLLMDAEGVRFVNECKPTDELMYKLAELLIQAYSEGLLNLNCSLFGRIPKRDGVYWITEDDTGETVAISRYLESSSFHWSSSNNFRLTHAYEMVWEDGVEQGRFIRYAYQNTYVGGMIDIRMDESGSWYIISIENGKLAEKLTNNMRRHFAEADRKWVMTCIDEHNETNLHVYHHSIEHWLWFIDIDSFYLIDKESVTKLPNEGEPIRYVLHEPLLCWGDSLVMCNDGSIWKYDEEMRPIDQAILKNNRKPANS